MADLKVVGGNKVNPHAMQDLLVAELHLTLLSMSQISHAYKSTPDMTEQQRVHDLAWRLGWVAGRVEQMLERIKLMTPTPPAAPAKEGAANA